MSEDYVGYRPDHYSGDYPHYRIYDDFSKSRLGGTMGEHERANADSTTLIEHLDKPVSVFIFTTKVVIVSQDGTVREIGRV